MLGMVELGLRLISCFGNLSQILTQTTYSFNKRKNPVGGKFTKCWLLAMCGL